MHVYIVIAIENESLFSIRTHIHMHTHTNTHTKTHTHTHTHTHTFGAQCVFFLFLICSSRPTANAHFPDVVIFFLIPKSSFPTSLSFPNPHFQFFPHSQFLIPRYFLRFGHRWLYLRHRNIRNCIEFFFFQRPNGSSIRKRAIWHPHIHLNIYCSWIYTHTDIYKLRGGQDTGQRTFQKWVIYHTHSRIYTYITEKRGF